MATIKVDHSKFSAAATEIDNYREVMRTKMNASDQLVNGMRASWNGADYKAFDDKWDDLKASGSVYANMRDDLKQYADFLRFAADKYKQAQIDAYNRANRLPKW